MKRSQAKTQTEIVLLNPPQAVAVMACENMHMSDDMILEPGLVMIFAHGVE